MALLALPIKYMDQCHLCASTAGNEDYVPVERNLTFATGQTVECVNIPILNDICLEEASEDFSVSISSDVECVIIDQVASSVEVTIIDDDGN